MGTDPATQKEVVEYYKNVANNAATVGDYVLVEIRNDRNLSCFGPKENVPNWGWEIVEIDWTNETFLLAPKKERDLYE